MCFLALGVFRFSPNGVCKRTVADGSVIGSGFSVIGFPYNLVSDCQLSACCRGVPMVCSDRVCGIDLVTEKTGVLNVQ